MSKPTKQAADEVVTDKAKNTKKDKKNAESTTNTKDKKEQKSLGENTKKEEIDIPAKSTNSLSKTVDPTAPEKKKKNKNKKKNPEDK